MTSSPIEKCYVLERDCFKLYANGVLGKKPADEKDALRLFRPKSLREEVMYLCHYIPLSGHQGIQRCKFYWWRMVLKSCVLRSDECCKNKKGQLPIVLL